MLCLFIWIFVHVVVESLPMSSSGHVALVDWWCRFGTVALDGYSAHIFSHFLHGINLALLTLFFSKRWIFLCRQTINYFLGRAHAGFVPSEPVRWRWVVHSFLLFFVALIADLITVFFYYYLPAAAALPASYAWGFFITGLLLILSAVWPNPSAHSRAWIYCPRGMMVAGIILGLMQAGALLPGISRLGSTYVIGILLGFSRRHAFEMSYVIQVPLLLGAWATASYAIFFGTHAVVIPWSYELIVAVIISTIVSWYALTVTWWSIQKGKIWLFGVYLLILAIVVGAM